MRKLTVFNFITLNGYYKGSQGDISWHQHGAQENEYAGNSLQAGNTLLFGRITYEMMAGYWSSAHAQQQDPVVAGGMNAAEKIVFSRTLTSVEWNNTRLVQEPLEAAIRQMKQMRGNDLTILGSGTIVTQLADAGLIDEFHIMVDPVALGSGVPIFQNLQHPLKLRLTGSSVFKSGVVLLSYIPK